MTTDEAKLAGLQVAAESMLRYIQETSPRYLDGQCIPCAIALAKHFLESTRRPPNRVAELEEQISKWRTVQERHIQNYKEHADKYRDLESELASLRTELSALVEAGGEALKVLGHLIDVDYNKSKSDQMRIVLANPSNPLAERVAREHLLKFESELRVIDKLTAALPAAEKEN